MIKIKFAPEINFSASKGSYILASFSNLAFKQNIDIDSLIVM